VPSVGSVLLEADAQIPVSAPPRPTLRIVGDTSTAYWAATAKVATSQPVTVAFAVRRPGSSRWQRLDVDDSPPYRGFLDPARFRKNEQVQVVAIARALDGTTSVSDVLPFRVR
jgi:hypothetical protein